MTVTIEELIALYRKPGVDPGDECDLFCAEGELRTMFEFFEDNHMFSWTHFRRWYHYAEELVFMLPHSVQAGDELLTITGQFDFDERHLSLRLIDFEPFPVTFRYKPIPKPKTVKVE